MPTITYHAEAATPTQLRDEIVADLRRIAQQNHELANATKRAKVAEEHRARAAAFEERADFWAAVIVKD